MSNIPQTTLPFLNKQTCATVCGINSQWLKLYPIVAGTVLPDTLNVLNIQGVQWEGLVIDATATVARSAWKCYPKRHPAALLIPGAIWIIQLEKIKMNPGSKALGKKRSWVRRGPDFVFIQSGASC